MSPTNSILSVVIQPRRGLFDLDLKAIWEYGELLYFLVWRDLKVRYKQTAIGATWAVLQPLMTMVIFTVVFGNFAKIPSDGLPYPIFSYTAIVPWMFFAGSLNRCVVSLVSNTNLIEKVYFPRLILPISATVSGLVDFAVALVILLGMMVWFGILPTWGLLALPFFLGLALMTALAVGLWLAPLNAKYRDVGYTVPFLVQCWMFASPVAYPVSMVPENWRILYGLNPMAGVIEGFRWALLGKAVPDFYVMAVSASVVGLLLMGGIVYFKKTERSFADVL